MRECVARMFVRYISGWINSGYLCNCYGAYRAEKVCAFCGSRLQWVLFHIAVRLDRDAMVDQMVEECWWG